MVKNNSELEAKLSKKRDEKNYVPLYFLSLKIENVRCFGPEQTLDLSSGKGCPARWTIILGDNGTGKTTLLQSLAALAPIEDENDFGQGTIHYLAPRMFIDFRLESNWKPFKYDTSGENNFLSATFFRGARLTENQGGEEVDDIVMRA